MPQTTTMTLLEQFANLRRTSTPLVNIRTTDANACGEAIAKAYPGVPVIQWDIAAGFRPRTKPEGVKAIEAIQPNWKPEDPNTYITNPAEAVMMLRNAPKACIVFMLNAHRLWTDPQVSQAIWNHRDFFKANQRMLVMFTTPEAMLPRELDSDTIVVNDPLPSDIQLAQIVIGQCIGATPVIPIPDGALVSVNDKLVPFVHDPKKRPEEQAVVVGIKPGSTMQRATDAVKGLSAFVAEQLIALALRRKGVNIDDLWERKRQAVEATPGATVYRGTERFDSIGGHEGLKRDLMREIRSRKPVKLVVIFDEIEKAMAGTLGDTSGVSQDQAQQILTYMQDHDVRGIIALGHPGAGKTAVAKAMANEAECLCIMADLGGMKGSLLGQSEQNARAFFALVTAIAGEGGAFFVATCNSTAVLTTEMRRRFKTGFYFVDLPTREEKDSIWKIKLESFELDANEKRPDDTNWTGAEIHVCCEKAWNYNISLLEAAKSVVPVAQSQPELITARRREAHGRMLSANTGMTYAKPNNDVPIEGVYITPAMARQVVDMPES